VLVTFTAVVAYIETLNVSSNESSTDDDSNCDVPTDVSPPTSETPHDREALLLFDSREAVGDDGSDGACGASDGHRHSSSAVVAGTDMLPLSHDAFQRFRSISERKTNANTMTTLPTCICNHCQHNDLSFVPGGAWVDPYPPADRPVAFPFPSSRTRFVNWVPV
jgi:hypothetical protein